MSTAAGLLLAAGSGRRMGRPKALVELGGVPLVRRALDVLRAGGCDPLLVVAGAAAQEVTDLVADAATVVTAADWATGMGASLRAGLAALTDPGGGPTGGRIVGPGAGPPSVVVHLVDLPGVTAAAVSRLVAAADGPGALARATYHGVPGHPVLLGRVHWAAVAAGAVGETGARDYLVGHPRLQLVECADVADPADVDTPGDLRRFR